MSKREQSSEKAKKQIEMARWKKDATRKHKQEVVRGVCDFAAKWV